MFDREVNAVEIFYMSIYCYDYWLIVILPILFLYKNPLRRIHDNTFNEFIIFYLPLIFNLIIFYFVEKVLVLKDTANSIVCHNPIN